MKVWIEDKKEIEAILERALVGRLGVIVESEPYVVPLNFVYASGRIYFHTGLEGRKLAAIGGDTPVCFEVDEFLEIVQNENVCFSTAYYRSVIITGKSRLLDNNEEKMRALELLLKKYSAGRSCQSPPEHALAIVNVCEILAEKFTAKANLPDAGPG